MEALAAWFQETMLPYGALGILVLAALDSSFVPMPAFIDIAVMGAAVLAPASALNYGIAAVVGSTAGVTLIYALARGGRKAAGARGGARTKWAEEFLRRRGTIALLVAALMPAPFPFKAVVLTAGYLRQPAPSMLVAIGAGRTIRFGSEVFLAARYGHGAIEALRAHGPLVALAMALFVAAAGFAFYKWGSAAAASNS